MTERSSRDTSAIVRSVQPQRGLLIGGRWRESSAGEFAVEDPATTAVIARVADGSASDATAAVDAAAAAADSWAAVAPRDRGDVLSRARAIMLRDVDDLAALISAENGKSVTDARAEVAYAAEFFRWEHGWWVVHDWTTPRVTFSLFTTDHEQARRVAERIDAGMVIINGVYATGPELPFGGIKRSGYGREWVPWASTSSSTRR